METIRVLLVEDDPDWLKAMIQFLSHEEDILIVGTALNREEAVQLTKSLEIDIVLMDINLTDNKMDGIHAAIQMCEIQKVKIIMLTSLQEEDLITQSFAAGVANYISKTNYLQLPHAIRSSYRDESPIEVLVKDYTRLKEEEQLRVLTPAEREIYKMVEQGYTQSQIEKELHKAERTIKNQVSTMLKKLGARSVKEAIEKIRRKGFFK